MPLKHKETYVIYMNKPDLALKNPQGLIWHKTQQRNMISIYKLDLAWNNLQKLVCQKKKKQLYLIKCV